MAKKVIEPNRSIYLCIVGRYEIPVRIAFRTGTHYKVFIIIKDFNGIVSFVLLAPRIKIKTLHIHSVCIGGIV